MADTFEVRTHGEGKVSFHGRLDAASAEQAQKVLAAIDGDVEIDFSELDYISSAGLGILIALYQRLKPQGNKVILTNLSEHVRYVFRLARLDTLLDIR